ncbi:MAG: type II toxin-antitoxin system VapC family toxin [Nitrospira sp.]|nr:type II toxin-antitoxin system VapC family toxin [Nitrospira sp.]
MPVKVVDASALAALLFGEPEAEIVASQLEHHTLAAPTILPFEIASVCLKKLRRHKEQREAIVTAYALLDRLAIEYVQIHFSEVIALAERSKLTVYDAAYLWLAQSLNAELVTLDSSLARAAQRPTHKPKAGKGQ